MSTRTRYRDPVAARRRTAQIQWIVLLSILAITIFLVWEAMKA
ncbi:hypothetical protein [uncultured Nocardioides sp.]|nr:hypothetical protein [uncultured Nocardioides sp.]